MSDYHGIAYVEMDNAEGLAIEACKGDSEHWHQCGSESTITVAQYFMSEGTTGTSNMAKAEEWREARPKGLWRYGLEFTTVSNHKTKSSKTSSCLPPRLRRRLRKALSGLSASTSVKEEKTSP